MSKENEKEEQEYTDASEDINPEEVISLADVLKKATDKEGKGVLKNVQGFGKMRIKILDNELHKTLQKRTLVGKDKKGNPIYDHVELSRLMVEACVLEPKIPMDELRKFGVGYLTTIVNAINEVSGLPSSQKDVEAEEDF